MPGTRKESFRRLARLIALSADPVAGGSREFPRGLAHEKDAPSHTFAQSGLDIDKMAAKLSDAFEKQKRERK